MRPLITTGYGSASKERNGASLVTRSWISRRIRIFEFESTWPETKRLKSQKLSAKAALRTMLESLTPSLPEYLVFESLTPWRA